MLKEVQQMSINYKDGLSILWCFSTLEVYDAGSRDCRGTDTDRVDLFSWKKNNQNHQDILLERVDEISSATKTMEHWIEKGRKANCSQWKFCTIIHGNISLTLWMVKLSFYLTKWNREWLRLILANLYEIDNNISSE